MPHFTPEYREGLTAFTRNFFHEMFRLAPNPSALVLDNFQEASASPEFLEIICGGIQEVPEGCCLILISRNDLPPLFARSCANREIKSIGWDDLRLTDQDVKDFLMRTSFLPYMTIGMAGNLSGNRDSGRILERCCLEHFFVDKRSHPEAIYQYHPLFREFLLTHAKKTCSREELLQLQGRSAHILKANGQIEEAARLFIEAEEWEGLSELILQHAGDFLAQGRLRLPESWLAVLPVEVMERSPWLYYYLGLCRLPVNPTIACKDLEVAYKMFKEDVTSEVKNSMSGRISSPSITG